MSIVRYELRSRGVFDRETGTHVLRGRDGWREYETWVRDGGVADPEPAAPIEPLEHLRHEKRAQVNGVRSEALRGATVELDGRRFQADPASASRLGLMLAVLAHRAPTGFEILWRDADNIAVRLDLEQLVRLGELMCGSVTQIFARSFDLKDGTVGTSDAPESIDLKAEWKRREEGP